MEDAIGVFKGDVLWQRALHPARWRSWPLSLDVVCLNVLCSSPPMRCSRGLVTPLSRSILVGAHTAGLLERRATGARFRKSTKCLYSSLEALNGSGEAIDVHARKLSQLVYRAAANGGEVLALAAPWHRRQAVVAAVKHNHHLRFLRIVL